jgi:hypothetical protein
MHAIKFRFTVALVLAGLLSAAGIVEMARSASLADTDCPTEPRVLESIIDSGTGGGRGDQTEVRWSSLIPGSFK